MPAEADDLPLRKVWKLLTGEVPDFLLKARQAAPCLSRAGKVLEEEDEKKKEKGDASPEAKLDRLLAAQRKKKHRKHIGLKGPLEPNNTNRTNRRHRTLLRAVRAAIRSTLRRTGLAETLHAAFDWDSSLHDVPSTQARVEM